MKLTVENENYCAIIVRVNHLNDYGLKTLVGFPIMGTQALVGKDTKIGSLGVLFTTESQLSVDYCSNNNLYRDSELNKDKEKKGFFELNRRVKAIKLAKQVSNSYFADLSSLSYLGINIDDFNEGDKFTHINGIEVCRKYRLQRTQGKTNKTRGLTKKFTRVDAKLFPEHWDTSQYKRCISAYSDNTFITCTQKIHGTSGRFANVKVRKLSKTEKLINNLDCRILNVLNRKPKFKMFKNIKKFLHDTYFHTVSRTINKIPFKKQYEYDTLAGSRRVIKDTKSENVYEDYYSCDIWNLHLSKIQHLIHKNWVIYGEIVGWVNNEKAIQHNYTYCLPPGSSELYVYRIAIVNDDGIVQDLSWTQIKHWCFNNGIKHVPELWRGVHKDFDVEKFLDIRYHENGYPQALPLDKGEDIVDEGICIRFEGLVPYVTKAKSPIFYEHETKDLDAGVEDIESQESGEEDVSSN